MSAEKLYADNRKRVIFSGFRAIGAQSLDSPNLEQNARRNRGARRRRRTMLRANRRIHGERANLQISAHGLQKSAGQNRRANRRTLSDKRTKRSDNRIVCLALLDSDCRVRPRIGDAAAQAARFAAAKFYLIGRQNLR